MIEHEYEHNDGRCLHCGTIWQNRLVKDCRWRADTTAPVRAIPPSCLDDNNAIAARLDELRAEHDAELAAPAEEAAPKESDPFDFSEFICGG